MFRGHNQDQDKHSGGPTLGPNCFNGNKQTAKVLPEVKEFNLHSGGHTFGPNCFNGNKQTAKFLPEVKDFNLPYRPQRKQILDCLEWTML